MDINIGEEKIVELLSSFTPELIEEKASGKRIDAFGQLVKFMQRPKPDEIQVSQREIRFEPFWYGSARAIYKYDRRRRFDISVTSEVHDVTVYEHEHVVQTGHTFQIEGMEHCTEEIQREMMLDPMNGAEGDYHKYLNLPKRDIQDLEALRSNGASVIVPEIRSSFLIGKLTQALMKTIQADKIHEQQIDVAEVVLYYRPVYAFEFLWKARDKRSVVEFDAVTGEMRAEPGQLKRQLVNVLDNDALFDIGADAVGTFVPGANIVVKLGRLAARKALK